MAEKEIKFENVDVIFKTENGIIKDATLIRIKINIEETAQLKKDKNNEFKLTFLTPEDKN